MRSSGSVDLVGAGAEGLEARVRELRWCRCRGRASAERSQQGKRDDAAVQWPRMDGGRTNARSAAGPFGARHRGKVGKDGAVLPACRHRKEVPVFLQGIAAGEKDVSSRVGLSDCDRKTLRMMSWFTGSSACQVEILQ